MQIIKDILSHCYNARNDTHLDGRGWCIPRERTQSEQIANLYENSSRVYSERKFSL